MIALLSGLESATTAPLAWVVGGSQGEVALMFGSESCRAAATTAPSTSASHQMLKLT